MRRVARWLRRAESACQHGAAWELVWLGGMAVLMWLFIMADCLAGVATVAGTAMVAEAVKWFRRRGRGRVDKPVERMVDAELSDESLQQLLTCWSKRYRR